MGFAFLIIPISCFLYTKDNHFDTTPNIALAINLTTCYATYIYMSIAYLILLGVQYRKMHMTLATLLVVAYPTPIWVSIASGDNALIDTVITSSYSFFVVVIIAMSVFIVNKHQKASKITDDTNHISIGVTWMTKSMKLLAGLTATCLLAPIFFTYTYLIRLIFMIYGALCYMHVYYGYRGMLIRHSVAQAKDEYDATLAQKLSESTSLTEETKQNIKREIDIWVEQRGYTSRDISLDEIARQVKTNRTYLSRYINIEYKCSYRVWITKLRVVEAKQLLSDHPELSISDIAKTVGSASIESSPTSSHARRECRRRSGGSKTAPIINQT